MVGRARDSEGTIPQFSGCKSDGRRLVISDLQESIHVIFLPQSRIRLSGYVSYLHLHQSHKSENKIFEPVQFCLFSSQLN